MKMDMLKFFRDGIAVMMAALTVSAAGLTYASEFPDKPIRVIVGYPPGGPTDIIARLVCEQMSATLGRPVIVENRPGAGGNIATQAVATSAPDGYTLLMGAFANAVNPTLMAVPYDSKRDLAPISMVSRIPVLIAASPNAPFSTVPELLAAAKANPGVLNYAAGGIGSSSHLAAEMFKRRGAVNITGIQYKGAVPALQDLMADRVQLYFDSPLTTMPLVKKDGRIKIIAVTTAKRLPWLPNVPTVAETGLPEFEVVTWVGLFGREGTPPAILTRLHKAVAAAVSSSKVKERFKEFGIDAVGNSPADFKEFFHHEMDVWARVIRESNIKVE
jgi:tripartite-type tricarboxylate transporter receptor subunit TctC